MIGFGIDSERLAVVEHRIASHEPRLSDIEKNMADLNGKLNALQTDLIVLRQGAAETIEEVRGLRDQTRKIDINIAKVSATVAAVVTVITVVGLLLNGVLDVLAFRRAVEVIPAAKEAQQ